MQVQTRAICHEIGTSTGEAVVVAYHTLLKETKDYGIAV